jgi:YD repeat-containing protein
MSCYITSGEAFGCSDGIGGVKKIWVVGGGGAVTGYTYNALGAITGATSTTGTTLYGFELKRNTSSLAQNVQKNFENGTIFFEQVLTAILFRYDQEKRNKLKVLSQNDQIQIIAQDQNNAFYLLGQVHGMYLSGGAATTGTAYGDRNGFEMIFTGQENTPANTLISTTLDANNVTGDAYLASIFGPIVVE